MSHFLDEVHQQPAALRSVLDYYCAEGRERLAAVRDLYNERGQHLLFTGMGSSYFAPMAILPLLTASGVNATCQEAGELLHYRLELCNAQTVVVAVSQSGESIETRRVVEKTLERCCFVAVTNIIASFLGRTGDILLPLCAGEETAISTKTYVNTLAVLHLLAAALTGKDIDTEVERIRCLADEMEGFLAERRGEIDAAAEFLQGIFFLYFIARGPSVAAAHQGALTFNEGARLPTCALPGGTFRHGPFEMVGREFAAVFFAPAGRTGGITTGMAREVAEAGGRVLLLSDIASNHITPNLRTVKLVACGEDLFPLNACLPVELLLYEMAHHRGREAGLFERISKVTSKE